MEVDGNRLVVTREMVRRRRLRQRGSTLVALKAELRSIETILSGIVVQLAYGYQDSIEDVKEFRRHASGAVQSGTLAIDPQEVEQKVLGLPDEDLAKFLAALPRRMETSAIQFHVPVLNSVLASQGVGLGLKAIEKLSMAGWQIHLLNREVRWLEEWLRLSFTITDEENHQRAVENQRLMRQGYRKRARYTLEAIREALAVISAKR